MKVFLTSVALKHFQKLDNNEKDKIKKITLLSSSPFSGKKLAGELKDSFTLRAWPYRIIYIINSHAHEIWITSILHRQGVYK